MRESKRDPVWERKSQIRLTQMGRNVKRERGKEREQKRLRE